MSGWRLVKYLVVLGIFTWLALTWAMFLSGCDIKPDVTVEKVDVTVDMATLAEACQEMAQPCLEAGIPADQCGAFIIQLYQAMQEEKEQQQQSGCGRNCCTTNERA